ncbi:MAG TPA: multicopper oxidase domain-containing protein [Solirubrobacteraceae bacterium]|nr:multicopper oxidase domain-containing protein [Solirubrobacteraceae bacterium]
MADSISRRRLLAALAPVVGAGVAAKLAGTGTPATAVAAPERGEAGAHRGHPNRVHGFRAGAAVDHRANGFNPTDLLRDFDMGRTRRLANGQVLREWEIVAEDKEIEIAPGTKFPAWTYNGRIPGPTLRCREGERLRIRFVNGSSHPHTMHFHGIHPAKMDGIDEEFGGGMVRTGESFTYEFGAEPFGLHLYHCHTVPLAEHIAKGLYGAFIVDPKDGRPESDELLMVMNAFDTNFDFGNEVYAVNTVGFHYQNEPIKVRRDELVRIYLINMVEYDPINSFHLHANFFHYFPTGTSMQPVEFTDTIMQAQGQRGILEVRFPHTGKFMFHAHKTEFAELGWLGLFEVED